MQRSPGLVFLVLLALSALGVHLWAQEAPSQTSPSTPAARKKVMIIPVDGVIDNTQAAFVKRMLARVREEKPSLVVFEIGTPGGDPYAAGRISTEIMGLQSLKIPTVAFIRPSRTEESFNAAASAGVIISLSCQKIYMYPVSVIGAAQVIAGSPQGGVIELPESVEEKLTSYLKEQCAELAKANGYPENLAILMVDRKWDEVYEVMVEGKKKYWTAQEIEKYEREKGAALDKPQFPVLPKGKLLTAGTQKAIEYGIATRVINNRAEIYPDYEIANPIEITDAFTWSEGIVGWLTDPIVRTILIAAGILGVWVEMKTPGFGVPGVVGILAFAVVLFGHNLAGLADAPEIALVILGLLLIVVELFVVPGTGLFAIAGILCFFVGLILSISPQGLSWPSGEFAWDSLRGPALSVFGSFVLASIVVFTLLRYLPHVPVFSRMALKTEITSTAVDAPEAHNPRDMLDKSGVAVTTLRPAGKVEINGATMDVTTRGEYIEKGESIKVIHVEGNRVVVSRPGIT